MRKGIDVTVTIEIKDADFDAAQYLKTDIQKMLADGGWAVSRDEISVTVPASQVWKFTA